MKRRSILKGLALAPLTNLSGVFGPQPSHGDTTMATGAQPTADATRTSRSHIAGMPLAEMREQYRYDLFDDYVPFWRKSGFDFDLGGFMCAVADDGTHPRADGAPDARSFRLPDSVAFERSDDRSERPSNE